MAYYVRDGEIVPVAVPLGRRVKIGSNYREPLQNHIANDQLWIQDVYTFSQIPFYAIKFRFERYLVAACLWFSAFVVLTFIGRYYLGAPV
ncbi:MAG: hypothetical protein EBT86_12045 [Actinobacteria bacterium]|nr:hypothetical protein [Actinomycetota bacterium]